MDIRRIMLSTRQKFGGAIAGCQWIALGFTTEAQRTQRMYSKKLCALCALCASVVNQNVFVAESVPAITLRPHAL